MFGSAEARCVYKAYRRPIVVVFSTRDELVQPAIDTLNSSQAFTTISQLLRFQKPHPADAKFNAALRGGSGRSTIFEQVTSTMERSFRKHGAGHLVMVLVAVLSPCLHRALKHARGKKEERE